MKPPAVVEPPDARAGTTGLPGFRTWGRVYLFVLASFVLWVGLLVALTLVYS